MPHIDIKSFPRHFDEEQKQAIAQALTDLVVMHFDSRPDAVSIALSYVQPER